MPDRALQQSLAEALAPDDAYDMPSTATVNIPSEQQPPEPPDGLCAGCDRPATEWQWSLDPAQWFATCGADHDGRRPWRIEDDRMLSWALRKMGEAQREIAAVEAEVDALFKEEMTRLVEWRDRAKGTSNMHDLRRKVAFFEAQAKMYLARLRLTDAKLKTLRAPAGVVKVIRSQPVQVDDPDALRQWALENGYESFLKIEPSKSGITEGLIRASDGTLLPEVPVGDEHSVRVPGVRVEQKDNYTVTPT